MKRLLRRSQLVNLVIVVGFFLGRARRRGTTFARVRLWARRGIFFDLLLNLIFLFDFFLFLLDLLLDFFIVIHDFYVVILDFILDLFIVILDFYGVILVFLYLCLKRKVR